MPVYEYRCGECGHVTRALRRIAEASAPTPCERCSSADTARIISRVSVHYGLKSKMDNLDPKYDKMVDAAMRSNPLAEPDTYLRRMTPTDPSAPRDD